MGYLTCHGFWTTVSNFCQRHCLFLSGGMAPVISILADTSPLSHLKICLDCEATRVSAAMLCKGRQYPDHQDWWYETVRYSYVHSVGSHCLTSLFPQCLNNHRPTHNTCRYFAWLEEIPKGRPTAPTLCLGTLCQELRAPKRINGDCTFGLCAPCCVDVRHVHPEVRSCTVSAHSKGVITRVGSGMFRITMKSRQFNTHALG